MNRVRQLTIACLCAALAIPAFAAEKAAGPPPWPKDVLDTATRLAVQEGGRVKPLDTYAQFLMLRINGKRGFSAPDGQYLGPVAWLLNCMFYPEVARDYKTFIVDNGAAIAELGLPAKEKRDRYSYNELLPAHDKLFTLAKQYEAIDAKQRDIVQQIVLNLANNVFEFEHLTGALEFARQRFKGVPGTELGKAIPEPDGVPASEALIRVGRVMLEIKGKGATLGDAQVKAEADALGGILDQFSRTAALAQNFAIFPPDDATQKEWRSAGELMAMVMQMPGMGASLRGRLAELEALATNRDAALRQGDTPERMQEFRSKLGALAASLRAQAEARGEYAKIPFEVHFYKVQYIFYSQWLYVLSFLLVALSWLAAGKWMRRAVHVSVALPTLLLIVGITLRCIIRGRPPVSTLYETILFITAVAVVVALFIEWANRQGIAIAMGSFLGVLGMFIANRYELKEGVDTMPSLVAVLDTNFWLSTHVTTVTTGYASGLLAGALAHIYLIGRLVGFRRGDEAFYRTVTRMVYGVICFGLLFATVGTILGGIWANYSWGRFWGWDPKENGALMIVLWALVVLHLRMGGYIKAIGVNICAVILAMIVAFSWWGVNLLGVGLHSYGFTSGIMNMLAVYWILEVLVIACGVAVYFRDNAATPGKPVPPPAPNAASTSRAA